MAEPSLKCNYRNCKILVTGVATVTSCSHIFCQDHKIVGFNRKCPACNTGLEGIYDAVRTNVNPPDDIKSFILIGLTSEIVFEIMERALQFWSFQIHLQLLYQNSLNDHLKRRLAKSESTLESMELQIKHYTQMQQQKVQYLKNEVETFKNAVTELEQQVKEKTQKLISLQSRCDALRCQSVTSSITTDVEPMERATFHYSGPSILLNREPAPPTPVFVFRPRSSRNTPMSASHSTPRLF